MKAHNALIQNLSIKQVVQIQCLGNSTDPLKAARREAKFTLINFPWDTSKSLHKAINLRAKFTCNLRSTKKQCSGGSESLIFTCFGDISVEEIITALSVIYLLYVLET